MRDCMTGEKQRQKMTRRKRHACILLKPSRAAESPPVSLPLLVSRHAAENGHVVRTKPCQIFTSAPNLLHKCLPPWLPPFQIPNHSVPPRRLTHDTPSPPTTPKPIPQPSLPPPVLPKHFSQSAATLLGSHYHLHQDPSPNSLLDLLSLHLLLYQQTSDLDLYTSADLCCLVHVERRGHEFHILAIRRRRCVVRLMGD